MGSLFRYKYGFFKELLKANSELLGILSDMEEKLKGDKVFGASYIKNQANRALMQTFQMVKSMDRLSGGKYGELYNVLEDINLKIKGVLDEKGDDRNIGYVMPYSAIGIHDGDKVGGKNASLGEIRNRVGLSVPEGFAITTRAFKDFLNDGGLKNEIIRKKNLIYVNDVEKLAGLSAESMTLIEGRKLPESIEKEILEAYRDLWEAGGQSIRVAMRSSAVGEDGDISYAGQYLTLLNVTYDNLIPSYKAIAASLYSARAITYRISKGIYDEDLAMAVACVRMVDAAVSGVMYTRHPYDIVNGNIIINAVWGLGPYAVDGVVVPDTYWVEKDKNLAIVKNEQVAKKVKLVCSPSGGVAEEAVSEEEQRSSCLSDDNIRLLSSYGMKLEEYYRCPQDVEWALDREGKIVILQSRPLMVTSGAAGGQKALAVDGYKVIIEDSEIACQGVGKGPSFHVKSMDDLPRFPEGGVLVAHHSSPEYVVVMKKASAIVVEAGSVSGHMAAIAREFGVPTLIGAKHAMNFIPSGIEVTVDAYSGRVYEGFVHELISAKKDEGSYMKDSPVYGYLKRVADVISPLHLVNPRSPRFTPSKCLTLHDIARFCHEYSYGEMFRVSDIASKYKGSSLKLKAMLPMDLHMIDLGGGLHDERPFGNTVSVEWVKSVPFKALLDGMMNRAILALGPRPVNFSGLLSVMREQAMAPGHVGERFGDRSYAIIADKYLNFSSRVGYHYSVVDAYCGDTVNKNYITFSFKGGAADKVKRIRRVRAISLILEREGFKVDVVSDKVDARIQKYPCSFIAEKIDVLGRLLIFTRQMDMLMTSEKSVVWVAENFLAGNYELDPMKEE
jgi:pyruvate,water dikinase